MDILKTLMDGLRKWKFELLVIPLAVLLFFAAENLIRWFEPTAGTYDAGVLQEMFLAFVKLLSGTLIAWILIRVYFREVWDYTEMKTDATFKDDFNSLGQKWRVLVALMIFFGLLFAFVFISKGATTSSRLPIKIGTGRELRTCIITTAKSQIGVRELTGHNDGKQVEKYLAAVDLGKGYAWCAAFCAWTLDQCNVKHVRSGYCPDYFKSGSMQRQYAAMGDMFGIWFRNKNRIAHVGFIERVEDTIVLTIEGNTNEAGSREGDGVYRKRRLLKQIYAVVRLTPTLTPDKNRDRRGEGVIKSS